jgi:hypothetical protein
MWDLPRITAVVMLVFGILCIAGIFVGGAFFALPDQQANMLKDVSIWCFGYATGGKFLNLAGEGIRGRKGVES